MVKAKLASAALLAGALILTGTACSKLKSRDDLNKGVNAYKNAKYGDAVEFFKDAINLDPENTNAHTYLATAYMMQWIPGAESAENNQFAAQAKEEFLKVLEKESANTVALASLASLAYNQATSLSPEKKLEKFDEAEKWNKQLIAADPKNKEAYYSLGVIAWAKWYPAVNLARVNLHMRSEDPGPIKDKKVKEELKTKYVSVVDEGIQDLNKALEIDPEYDDAMAYLNLLIREKADLADTPEEYKQQMAVADGWVQKALDTKKAKAARTPAGAGGIVQDAK